MKMLEHLAQLGFWSCILKSPSLLPQNFQESGVNDSEAVTLDNLSAVRVLSMGPQSIKRSQTWPFPEITFQVSIWLKQAVGSCLPS